MATRIISKLRELRSTDSKIKQEIIDHVLEYYQSDDEVICFFRNLLKSGCESGMVSNMVYYSDTHAFFDRHYCEIEDLRYENLENYGEPMLIRLDLKNHLACFAYEEIAWRLADELGIEV